MALNKDGFKLPGSIATATDLAHVRMELERISEQMLQERLRTPDKVIVVPRISSRLNQAASNAGMKLESDDDRQTLLKHLEEAARVAPKVKISFATNPSDEFLTKIVEWFRQNINDQVLFTIGLQPSIAAGFVMRTPSKFFDCSMRKHFDDNKHLLAQALKTTGVKS